MLKQLIGACFGIVIIFAISAGIAYSLDHQHILEQAAEHETIFRNVRIDGTVSPDEFIAVAESTGVIIELGDYVLERSLKTFREWLSLELSEDNQRMLYIPEGFAHGFLTLEDNTEVFYQMSEFYAPGHARGVRWNDPVFNIVWPIDVKVISEKDDKFPDYRW